jgi:hypothetical protein
MAVMGCQRSPEGCGSPGPEPMPYLRREGVLGNRPNLIQLSRRDRSSIRKVCVAFSWSAMRC